MLNLNGKKILITGGAGFIGSNLALSIERSWPQAEVVVFDRFRDEKCFGNGNLISLGHWENLVTFRGEVICGDINDPCDLDRLRGRDFDFILHQAAISDTRADNHKLVMQTNVNAFGDLLGIAVDCGAKMIYASSAATYGSALPPQSLGREAPDNVYGYSKRAMDDLAKCWCDRHDNLQTVGLRYFNVYGPGEFYKGKTASMVLQLGLQILDGRAPRLFEGSDMILRDFVHIDDVVAANFNAMEYSASGVFNVGYGSSRSFKDIADILLNEMEATLPIDYFPNPFTGYQMHTEADISASKDALGYVPEVSLEQGIADYVPVIRDIYSRHGYSG